MSSPTNSTKSSVSSNSSRHYLLKMKKSHKTPSVSPKSSPKTVSTIPSDTVISKIIQHSRNPSSPRLLKYLLEVKKNFSSVNFKLWMDLRTKGGLHAIETVVRSFANTGQFKILISGELTESIDSNSPDINHSPVIDESSTTTKLRKDILSNGLSILGNSYSLDYSARKEVLTSGFINVLHRIITMSANGESKFDVKNPSSSTISFNNQQQSLVKSPPSLMSSAESDITMKAVKCIANLARDYVIKDAILKLGLGISIIKILDRFNDLFLVDDNTKFLPKEERQENLLNFATLPEEAKDCIRASVRAIRILSSEPCSEDGKNHLIRFGAVISIGKILSWNVSAVVDERLLLDVIRTITSLTDRNRIRLLPMEQVEELVSEDIENVTLKRVIEVFSCTSVNSTLFSSTVRCLTNLAYNTTIAECLGKHFIFKVSLEKLKQTSGKSSSELCRLLLILTKHSSVNQCLLHNCQEIWSTLQILKCSDLEDYHRWILHVYENVYEGSLKSLIRNGLLELIHEQFKLELEDCDYEMLKAKIASLDDSTCKVHSNDCQFKPVYRCDSPSYQQVQEEIRTKLQMDLESKKFDVESSSSGIDSSSSPSSSPARSWASDDSNSELSLPRSRSPTTSISEDEGCYSPVDNGLSYSPTYSESNPGELGEPQSTSPQSPSTKRPRLDSGLETSYLQESAKSKSESIKNKSKKIVSMLNILHKATFLSPMPSSLVQIVPILLSFLTRGIVSISPQRDNYEDTTTDLECLPLGRQSFNLAYRILKTMCLNINMLQSFISNGTINIISRLMQWDQVLNEIGTGSGQNMANLMGTLCGKNNDTAGWREGYLLRTLLISKSEDELNRIALTIPLMYRKNDHVLRNFESKGNSWTRIFDVLVKSVDNRSLFQDCIFSISTLCSTVGMKYATLDATSRPMLRSVKREQLSDIINQNQTSNTENNGKVRIILEDGSSAYIQKELLTEASPVFSAMFDGHFIETGSQQVQIRDVSLSTIFAVVEQLYAVQNGCNIEISEIDSNYYDLSTLFELLSISDQFLLESVYERTLNTLLCYYICPYAAPTIYSQAVKLSSFWKPQSRLKGLDMDLTFIVLKYLLVGDLNVSSKCLALQKIFDIVPHATVVGDIRALIEFYSSRPPQ